MAWHMAQQRSCLIWFTDVAKWQWLQYNERRWRRLNAPTSSWWFHLLSGWIFFTCILFLIEPVGLTRGADYIRMIWNKHWLLWTCEHLWKWKVMESLIFRKKATSSLTKMLYAFVGRRRFTNKTNTWLKSICCAQGNRKLKLSIQLLCYWISHSPLVCCQTDL